MKTIFNTIYMSVNSHLKSSVRSAHPMLFGLRYAAVLIMLVTLSIGNAWGDSYSWTLASGDLGTTGSPSSSVSKGSPSKTWSASYTWGGASATKYFGYDNSKGVQIGSGNATNKCSKAVFTTSGITGTITNITVHGSHASSGGAKITIKVGSTTVKSQTNFTTSDAAYSTGTISVSGTIEITIDNSASKAFYIKSIDVTYTAGASTFTVTVNSNNNSYGTVDKSSVTSVANNTSISASSNVLTVGSTTVTATPHAQDADYNYAFSSWSGIPAGGKVTANVTVTANFTRTARTLTNYRTSCVACEAPTSVSITGTNKYLGGQTISLTATPTGGTGTPSYQWQKKINSVWTDLSNGNGVSGATAANLQISSCTHANSGGYRCIVSTGEGCETKSHADDNAGYGVHVYSIYGRYYNEGEWAHNEIAYTSGTTGTATVHLSAKKTYTFKVRSNNDLYYGNSSGNFIIQPATNMDCGTNNSEIRLFTTIEGDYTITVDIAHGLDNSPYVTIAVSYPSMTHPNSGYVYVQKFSWRPYLHYWYDNSNKLTEWGSDPQLNSDQYTSICGTEYWCVPVIDYYCNFIAKDAAGDPSNTTGDQHTNSPHPGQRLYNNGSWQWGSFTTYTISYAGGDGSTGGPMAPHTGICPGSSQQLTANAFSKANHTFDGWSDGNGHTYANQATITNIQSNIDLTAQWAPAQYSVTHTLSNATATSGATGANAATYGTNYTAVFSATSGYMLPSTITVMAGASNITANCTWTQGTGSLTIPGAYITGDITITISAIQAYTVTFVHHDKGTYSGGSTEWIVPSNDNTITLPTVTDVSCGFYDTFEGWIASNSEYAESDDKPASVYAGISSYTVQGNVTLRALYSYEDPDAAGYTKITSGVTAGTYLIATDEGSGDVAYTGKHGTDSYGGIVAVTVTDGVISSKPDAAKEITVTLGTGANAGYFAMHDGSQYLKNGGCSSNAMGWQNDIVYDWELDANGNIHTTACSGTNDRNLEFGNGDRFACYKHTQKGTFLYKKGGSKYCTNPSCVKPVGVHITYNANGGEMTCSNSNKTYKVVSGDNKYPQLASAYSFCTNATRTGYTLVGWNTRADGLGTTYDIDHSYSNLPVSGDLDGENWVTLNLYAMWASAVSFNLGNATGGTGVPAVVEEDGGFMLPEPTAAQIGTIPCGYSFYGWSESSVAATSTKPTLYMPGTKYTGSYRTLYAVYRLAGEGGNPDLFSLSYMYNSTKYYVAASSAVTTAPSTWDYPYTKGGKFAASTNAEDAIAFGMKTNADHPEHKEIYWVYGGDETEKIYLQYSSGASVQFNSQEDTYYQRWAVTGTNELTFQNYSSSRYLSGDNTEIGCPSSPNTYTFTKEEASTTTYTYATNPSCETTATLAFVTNGGTMNYPDTYDADSYVDLTVGTNVYLPTATYPGEWVFEGWMKGAPVSSTDIKPESANFIEVTLNTTQYTATPAGTTTFYAVFSKTTNDKQWDPSVAGTYKIFAIMSDGTTKKYMPAWDGTQTTLSAVTNCVSTGEYTITPGTGDHAGQYKITHGSYTLGVRDDANTQFKNVADAWWNIEASTSGKGTYRITIVGSSNRCLSYSGFDTFGNYTISQVNSPTQPNYRDVEIGECIYTEYTSTPENIPYITITGSPVKITSANGQRVYAPTKLHVEAHNFSTTRTIHFSATNGFATSPASVNTAANGAYSGDIDIYYQPTSNGTGSITTSVLTASQSNGPAAEHVSQTFSAIKGRNLPQNFVIAVKSGSQWYALPDDCHSSGTPAAVPIDVNDPSAPTAASLVPHNVEWRLHQVVGAQSSGSRPKDKIYFYEPNDNNYALKANSAPNISTEAQVSNIGSANSAPYEWGLSTSDLCAYTISNANVSRNISINESGNFGTHATNVVSDVLYLLPITAYYETAKMQVLEWKANSVVVMYTGTQTTATTQVGSNSASSAQTLASQKLTHAIYELTTGQALTSNAGEALKVSFGGGAEIIYVNIPIIINSAVTASESHESQDVVIVSGGKLTAASDKYSFHNIYVYGGGKLKIASGSQLGVNNIIMRAGGVTTNGSGGSATYVYTYPQVELGGTLTSTVADIKYEYITDYDHWYHFCLPFNANLNTIHYPQEYYGDNVTAGNSGSWVIKRYAGEIRATGSYEAWKDIETESATSVTAGKGYLFWGAPKKVGIGDAAKVRQQWGIQRITMATAASAATTAETANKNITVDSYSEVATSTKPNDQGWNLVGNPYMVNLTGLSSESLIAGELVHSNTDPWDGKWINDGTGTRYVTIPDNHFDNYEARTMASFTALNPMINGRTFFVQIAEGASTLTFAAANRASLMPALFATTKATDIETGIVMSDETHKDEVNFWIKEGKTADYEFNADYPKTPNATNFNIYGVHSQGDLSWIAISPEIAESPMAIGYQVPAAGDYTLSLSETYTTDDIDHFFVTDHETSPEITTDLMDQDYVFHVNQAETNNTRFTVSIKLKDEDTGTTTGIDNLDVNSDVPTKFIYQDKMYILYHGVIYDATGKRVSIIKR